MVTLGKKPHVVSKSLTPNFTLSRLLGCHQIESFRGNTPSFQEIHDFVGLTTPLHVSKNHRLAPSLSRGLDGGGNVFYTPCLLLATSQRIALAAAAAAPPPVPLLPPPPPPSSAAFSPEFSLAILGNGSRIGDKPVRVSLKLGKAGSMGRVGASTAGRSEQVCRLRCS